MSGAFYFLLFGSLGELLLESLRALALLRLTMLLNRFFHTHFLTQQALMLRSSKKHTRFGRPLSPSPPKRMWGPILFYFIFQNTA